MFFGGMRMEKELEELWAQLTEEQKAILIEKLKNEYMQSPAPSAPV